MDSSKGGVCVDSDGVDFLSVNMFFFIALGSFQVEWFTGLLMV